MVCIKKTAKRHKRGGEDEVTVISGRHAQSYGATEQGKDQRPELPFAPVAGIRKVRVGGVGTGPPRDPPKESTLAQISSGGGQSAMMYYER